MTSFIGADNFSFDSLREEIAKTSKSSLKADLLAGLQVALLTLPQAIAYALVAGLPLSASLFAAIFSPVIALFFSSSKSLITGPVNTIAIMIQMSVATILFTSFHDILPQDRENLALQLVVQVTLLVGLFQVIIALFKLGRLIQFVSHSVVLGYLGGSLIAVVINQLYPLFGIVADPEATSLFDKLWDIFSRTGEFHLPTLMIGAISFVSIILLKRISIKIPGALITIILASIVLYFFQDIVNSPLFDSVKQVGSVSSFNILPVFYFPHVDLKLINTIFPIAIAIALLAMLETACTAKSMAAKSKEPISVNQEILSIGMGNLGSSLLGAMPISVSPTRSALNHEMGAKTRLSGLFSAIFVALLVTVFAFYVTRIPVSALSALIIITVFVLLSPHQIMVCLKATKADRWVLVSTFLACLFFSLEIGFYIGVALSITSYLRKAALPQVVEYAVMENGELRAINLQAQYLKKPIRVIKIEGELFFASAEVFENTLKAITEDDDLTRAIILQVKNARDIDATTCLTLIELKESLEKRNCALILAGVTLPVWDVLSYSGAVERLGKENLFIFDERSPHRYLQKALERANKLIAAPG